LLTHGAHDLPARQQTVAATITWSYDLLDPDGQDLFRRLAVFAGGFTLEAIAVVAGGDRFHVLKGIEALCEQSLLRTVQGADGEDRYTMLETVHEYALARLDESGEATPVRDAHAAHFLALAEAGEFGLRGPDEATWNARLEAEYPNLRAALEWSCQRGNAEQAWRLAGALFHFWSIRNDFAEGQRRLTEALSLPGPMRTAAWAKALTALGYMTHNRSDFPRARALLEEALAVWRELGDQRGIAMALAHTASLDWNEGNLDRARDQGEEALTTYRRLGDRFDVSTALQILGAISLLSGDYPRARAELEEGLQLLQGLDSAVKGALASTLGWLSLAEGDERRAAALWEEQLASCRKRGHELAIAVCQDALGWLALRQGNHKRAASCFAEELALGAKLGVAYEWARGLLGLAIVSVETGQAARAAWLFGAAETAASGKEVIDNDPQHPIREPYDRAVTATQQALGEAAFTAAWRAGRDVPRQQAVPRALTDVAAEGLAVVGAATYDRLTRRETEVLRLLVQRWTDNEIADTLCISSRTASHHVARIFSKLGVGNRREARAVAARLGFV
jgi:DNA-binding CsgD family transcriptional regulator/tetratricopeptide (TPR) repeat protein